MGRVKKTTSILLGALLASLLAGGMFRAANYEWAESTVTTNNYEWAGVNGINANYEWAAPAADAGSFEG